MGTTMRNLIAGWVVLSGVATAHAQLRVASWNISNYSGGRTTAIQTAVYGVFEGRSFAPDAMMCQEILSSAATTAMISALNTAPGSPGDWAAAPFVDGPDTDSAFFYRTSRVQFLGLTVVAVGGVSPNHPRNIQRYDIQPIGYASPEAVIACYSSHMKSGSDGDDFARRLLEAQRIRDDAQALPAGWSFLLGGDFNIQNSGWTEYQELVGSQSNNVGRFFDPILTPGNWNNNSSFRYVHTQDPIGAGGMDDRHDQLLVSTSLRDTAGLQYLGLPVAYSTSTWDDPNHSYRSWGNDGSTFNATLRVAGNAMVGATIAQALIDCANGAGHLPVFMDVRVPAVGDADLVLDFGEVELDDLAELSLRVENIADDALWNAGGIDSMDYTMSVSGEFAAPAGPFAEPAGGGFNSHVIAMDTSTVGVKAGSITITTDAPDTPVLIVTLMGEVVDPSCAADLNGDGILNVFDFLVYQNLFTEQDPSADLNGDGVLNVFDFLIYQNLFTEGC